MTNTQLEFRDAKWWLDETYGEGFAVDNPTIWAAVATSSVAETDAELLRDAIDQAVRYLVETTFEMQLLERNAHGSN